MYIYDPDSVKVSRTKSISAEVFCSYLTAPDKTTVASNKDSVRDWTGFPLEMVAAPSLDTLVTRMSNLHLWIQSFHYPTIHQSPPSGHLSLSPPQETPTNIIRRHQYLRFWSMLNYYGNSSRTSTSKFSLPPFFFVFLTPCTSVITLQIFFLSSLTLSQ